MKYTIAANLTTTIALPFIMVLFGVNQAVAQEAIEKVVFQPSYEPIQINRPSLDFLELKTDSTEIKRHIKIDDLDLSNSADITKLNSRIKIVAKESCQRLSDMFPSNPSDREEMRQCTKKAMKSTKKQIKRIIEAAN